MTLPEPDLMRRVAELERELANLRRYAARATKELHARMAADLATARKATEVADARIAAAEKQAAAARKKVAAMRASRRWRAGEAAGQALRWVPAKVRAAAHRGG